MASTLLLTEVLMQPRQSRIPAGLAVGLFAAAMVVLLVAVAIYAYGITRGAIGQSAVAATPEPTAALATVPRQSPSPASSRTASRPPSLAPSPATSAAPMCCFAPWRLDIGPDGRVRVVIGNLDAVGFGDGWQLRQDYRDIPALPPGPLVTPGSFRWWCVITPKVKVVRGSDDMLRGGFSTQCQNRPGRMWYEALIQRTSWGWRSFSPLKTGTQTRSQTQSGEVAYPCNPGGGIYTYRLAVVVYVTGVHVDANPDDDRTFGVWAYSSDLLRTNCGKGITPL